MNFIDHCREANAKDEEIAALKADLAQMREAHTYFSLAIDAARAHNAELRARLAAYETRDAAPTMGEHLARAMRFDVPLNAYAR